MSVFAYFIGGPADLSKQVFREASSIVNFAEIQPFELNLRTSPGDLVSSRVVQYRRRGRLENQGQNEVWIYEVIQ